MNGLPQRQQNEPEHLAEELVSIIEKNAFAGLRGDGKVYVSDVDSALKIGKGKIG